MIDYKCPYCNANTYSNSKIKFNSWEQVRRHFSRCKLNNKLYIICLYYGPISLETINSYQNLKELKIDYPNITINKNVWNRLRKENKISLTRYTLLYDKQSLLSYIKQFVNDNNRLPNAREFNNNHLYPSYSTYQKQFGSWNNAIIEAGFSANDPSSLGNRIKGKDHILYRSDAETYFSNNYLFNEIEYEYEKSYGNGWFCDFYLPKYSLYIEIDGGMRPERIKEKIEFCKNKKLKLLVIPVDKVYDKKYVMERIK